VAWSGASFDWENPYFELKETYPRINVELVEWSLRKKTVKQNFVI